MSTGGLFGLGEADHANVPGALLAIGLAISAGRLRRVTAGLKATVSR